MRMNAIFSCYYTVMSGSQQIHLVPIGKKHKMLAFYRSLANIDTTFRSTVHIIQLAILCKSSDIRHFGYGPDLKPQIPDLVLLENDGIFIEKLGMCMKGTLAFVVADNLRAHSIGGFIEFFWARPQLSILHVSWLTPCCICREHRSRCEK